MMSVPRGLAVALLLLACRRDAAQTPAAHNHPAPAVGAADDVPPCHRHGSDASAAPAAARPLPDTSLFHLESDWTTQSGARFRFASLRGTPTFVLMFYGSCQAVCPILIGDVLRVEAALTPAARARTRFVLITLDPATDTPARLAELAASHHLDPARWTLLHGTDEDVRTVATVLGVQYSRIGPAEYTHSNTITLLDPQGLVAQQLEGLRQPVEPIARAAEAFTP
jgi:protein SCO1/2